MMNVSAATSKPSAKMVRVVELELTPTPARPVERRIGHRIAIGCAELDWATGEKGRRPAIAAIRTECREQSGQQPQSAEHQGSAGIEDTDLR